MSDHVSIETAKRLQAAGLTRVLQPGDWVVVREASGEFGKPQLVVHCDGGVVAIVDEVGFRTFVHMAAPLYLWSTDALLLALAKAGSTNRIQHAYYGLTDRLWNDQFKDAENWQARVQERLDWFRDALAAALLAARGER